MSEQVKEQREEEEDGEQRGWRVNEWHVVMETGGEHNGDQTSYTAT